MTDPKSTGKTRQQIRTVYSAITHDSAAKHVAGSALYVDDIPEPAGLLHAYFGTSELAHARIISMDLSAVNSYPGVIRTLTAADIPGDNEISPIHKFDESRRLKAKTGTRKPSAGPCRRCWRISPR